MMELDIRAAILLFFISTENVYCSDTFEKQPADNYYNYGVKVIIPCKVSDKAEQCVWVKDGKDIDLADTKQFELNQNKTLGDCELTIKKFTVYFNGQWSCRVTTDRGDTLHSKTAKLEVLVRPRLAMTIGSSVVSMYVNIIFNPDSNVVTVKCSSGEAYPTFPESGTVVLHVNNEVHTENGTIEPSTTKPGLNSMVVQADLTFPKEGLTDVTCSLNHTNTKATSRVTFMPSTKKIELSKQKEVLIFPNDKTTLEPKDQFGVRDMMYSWSEERDGKWVEIPRETKKSYLAKCQTDPGKIVNYKLKVTQTKFLNVPIESEPASIMCYTPMTNISIISPLKVKIAKETILQCAADGVPKPEIFWFKVLAMELKEVGKSENLTIIDHGAGLYKCGAIQKRFGQEIVVSSFDAVRVY